MSKAACDLASAQLDGHHVLSVQRDASTRCVRPVTRHARCVCRNLSAARNNYSRFTPVIWFDTAQGRVGVCVAIKNGVLIYRTPDQGMYVGRGKLMRMSKQFLSSAAVPVTLLCAGTVYGQESDVGVAGPVSEVVVTGSRIVRQDYVADSPVVTFGAEQW